MDFAIVAIFAILFYLLLSHKVNVNCCKSGDEGSFGTWSLDDEDSIDILNPNDDERFTIYPSWIDWLIEVEKSDDLDQIIRQVEREMASGKVIRLGDNGPLVQTDRIRMVYAKDFEENRHSTIIVILEPTQGEPWT